VEDKMTMDAQRLEFLECTANEARQLVLKTVNKSGAGHVGGPLSAIDALVALYFEVLRIDPQNPTWEDRDRFILSKGHASIALYAVMALRGYLPVDELETFDEISSRLQGHPCMKSLPGVDMSSGSLGQGLSPGIGMGLGARMRGKDFHTWVMLGDGELQEGQVWEAAFVASRYCVDNVTAIVDNNKLQLWGWTKQPACEPRKPIVAMPNIGAKFAAFDWAVLEIDGHDIMAILDACAEAKTIRGRPTVIISNTVKGKGVSFMENQCAWHAKPPNVEELSKALTELQVARPEGVR
jgi:transketolase